MFVRGLRPELLAKAYSALSRRASLWMLSRELAREQPDLLCISSGSPTDDIDLITFCLRSGRPYVLITQANAEFIWPNDAFAEQMVRVFRGARRAYFVAQPNLRLLEAQLGTCLTNAEVIRNPFNVRWEACPAWPPTAEPLRLACVARLDPSAKGQDLLLHVLASDLWRLRPVEISFYGQGPMETSLRRLVRNLGLNERVRFCGQEKDVERIWASHQALVLPSRFEGLPLAIVEAMLCGRPVIVTDVAGNAELVEDGVTGFVAEARPCGTSGKRWSGLGCDVGTGKASARRRRNRFANKFPRIQRLSLENDCSLWFQTPDYPVRGVMLSPQISVILPCYNHECFVGEAVTSILGQSFRDLELIVVDDHSRDDSVEVLRAIIRNDSRLKLIVHDQNRVRPVRATTGCGWPKGRLSVFVTLMTCGSRTNWSVRFTSCGNTRIAM